MDLLRKLTRDSRLEELYTLTILSRMKTQTDLLFVQIFSFVYLVS